MADLVREAFAAQLGEPLLLSIPETALWTGFGESTIRELIAQGELATVKAGKAGSRKPAHRVVTASVHAWLAAQTAEAV